MFDADPADKLFANRSGDFFIARTQDWIAQVSASLTEILHGVGARSRRTAEAFDLGKYVPDPVATFAAGPNFREGRVVASPAVGLSFVKSFQRHSSQSIRPVFARLRRGRQRTESRVHVEATVRLARARAHDRDFFPTNAQRPTSNVQC